MTAPAHMDAEPIVMPAPLDDEIDDWAADVLALFAPMHSVEPGPEPDRVLAEDGDPC